MAPLSLILLYGEMHFIFIMARGADKSREGE